MKAQKNEQTDLDRLAQEIEEGRKELNRLGPHVSRLPAEMIAKSKALDEKIAVYMQKKYRYKSRV